MIGLTDFSRQWADIERDVLEATARVGKSAWYVLGKEVSGFEQALTPWFTATTSVGCASGLDALELALRAHDVRPGDRVLTTPLTAFATTLAVLRVGAVPVFADVDEHGLLDLDDAEKRGLADVRFVIPVHLFGHMVSPGRLRAFASRHGATVIEDAAQAIGATYGGEKVGAASQLCATSFYPTKNLGALGDGGAVLCNDAKLDLAVRQLRDYGQSDKYVHDTLGLNSRLDELQAGILSSALLPRLGAHAKRRTAIAERYVAAFACHARIRVVVPPKGCESAWHLFAVLVKGSRDAFRQHLQQQAVGTGLHYPKLTCDQRAYLGAGLGPVAHLPNARLFADSEVSIPLHPYLTDQEVDSVIAAVHSWRG